MVSAEGRTWVILYQLLSTGKPIIAQRMSSRGQAQRDQGLEAFGSQVGYQARWDSAGGADA
jgi:hypothetical protein